MTEQLTHTLLELRVKSKFPVLESLGHTFGLRFQKLSTSKRRWWVLAVGALRQQSGTQARTLDPVLEAKVEPATKNGLELLQRGTKKGVGERGQPGCPPQTRVEARTCARHKAGGAPQTPGPSGLALLPRPLALSVEKGCREGRMHPWWRQSHHPHIIAHCIFWSIYSCFQERDHSFICGSSTPKVPNKRPETKRQAQRPLTNIPSSKAKHYHGAIFMARGSYAPLILKKQDETPYNLCFKSMFKFYFKCFMIRDTKSYLMYLLRISCPEAICKCCRVSEVGFSAEKKLCSEIPRGTGLGGGPGAIWWEEEVSHCPGVSPRVYYLRLGNLGQQGFGISSQNPLGSRLLTSGCCCVLTRDGLERLQQMQGEAWAGPSLLRGKLRVLGPNWSQPTFSGRD